MYCVSLMKMSLSFPPFFIPQIIRGHIVQMSHREGQRYYLLHVVLDGRTTLKDAGERMGESYRDSRRMKRKLTTEGSEGLILGNRGRPSPKVHSREVAERIVDCPTTSIQTLMTPIYLEIEGNRRYQRRAAYHEENEARIM